MTQEKIKDLKEQGYKIIKIDVDEKVFYFKKPSKGELMLYQDSLVKNKGSVSIAGCSEKFVRQLFVGENVEEFSNYLDEKPLAIGNFLEECLRGMGADENFTATEV